MWNPLKQSFSGSALKIPSVEGDLFPSSVQLCILNVFGFCFIIKSQHKYLFSRGESVY